MKKLIKYSLIIFIVGIFASRVCAGKLVTSKEIEVFGGEYVGSQVVMSGRFIGVDNTWDHIFNKNKFIGFFMYDSNNDLFQHGIADKKKWGRYLLNMKNQQKITVTGTIQKCRHTFCLILQEINRQQ